MQKNLNRRRPHFKSSFQYKTNLLNRPKFLKFKRKKWQKLSLNNDQLTPWKANQAYKNQYGLRRSKDWKKAILESKKTGNLIGILERRLDVVLWRMRLASTIFESGQRIYQGHVCVNGKKVTQRSLRLKPGDLVSLHLPTKQKEVFVKKLKQTDFFTKTVEENPQKKDGKTKETFVKTCEDSQIQGIPNHLEVSFASLSGIFVTIPVKNFSKVNLLKALEMHP